jgi:Zn-dependent M16 (insulinase) family peptidase
MNIVKRIDQYNKNNIFFCEPIKNNVMNEGNFIRIIYSTHNVTLNGIYLLVTLNDITCDKYYTKYRCNFNVIHHKEIIDNLKIIEEELLKKTEIFDKTPQFKIYEQLKNGNLKIFSDVGNKSLCSFILKISGIWETQNNFGLTYKFIKIN